MTNGEFDFSHLLAFEKAAETRNFTQAATALGLSQPALSHRIRLLEDSLGRRLFQRRHKGVALTGDGEVLYEAVRVSLARIRDVVERFRREGAHERIRISLDFAIGSLWLMPRLARAEHATDNIDLQIKSGHLAPADHIRDSDIAFVLADPRSVPADAIRLFAEEVVPVCSPAFLAAHPEAAEPERLLELPLIHNEAPTDDAWLSWRDWALASGLEWNPSGAQASFTAYQMVLQTALAGRGLALGWHGLVDDLLASGQLVTPVKTRAGSHRWYLAVLSGNPPPSAARALLAAIRVA